VNPASLIHQFVTQRYRHENFDSVSRNGDLEIIKNTWQAPLAAMSRGNWFLAHSSKPSAAGANMHVDMFTQSGITSVNTNFRMLIICTSLKYMSPSMIGKSKRICVESLPSVRFGMAQMYHDHAATIRRAVNPKTIKGSRMLAECCCLSSGSAVSCALSEPTDQPARERWYSENPLKSSK
jgi:hypothetical protein